MQMMKKSLAVLILAVLHLNAIDIANRSGVDMAGTSFIDYIRFVSNSSNINIVVDEKIDNKFSLILPNDYRSQDNFKILKSILYKNDMYITRYGTVYYINKNDVQEKYYSKKLVFILPDKIIKIIKEHNPDIVISKSKKTLIFKSTHKVANKIYSLIELLDKPIKEKKVKITLVSYDENNLKEFGINMNISLFNPETFLSYTTFINNLSLSQTLSYHSTNMNLDFYLSDLKSNSIIDFKFSPIISLFDNEKTSFNITKNIPYLSSSRSVDGSNAIEDSSFTYKDVGSKILIDKVSIIDEAVYFHIQLQYEVIIDSSSTPITSKKSIDNYIKLKNGESIMIAGIKGSDVQTLKKEIPMLSSIPYLGELFKWESNSRKDETFAIFIQNVDIDATYKNLDVEAIVSSKRGPAKRGNRKRR